MYVSACAKNRAYIRCDRSLRIVLDGLDICTRHPSLCRWGRDDGVGGSCAGWILTGLMAVVVVVAGKLSATLVPECAGLVFATHAYCD